MNSVISTSFRNSKIYAWLLILVCSAFLFYKYVLQVYPGIITNNLMRAFHVQGVGLGNLAATFFYTYLIMQLFVGILVDRYGVRWLASFAIMVSAAGAFLFSYANTLWLAEFARALMGIGAAFATVSYMKLAAVWFRVDQFAFIAGLLATATMLGAVFGEAPLSLLIDHIGWRESLFICGFIGVGIALLFVLFVQDHNPNRSLSLKNKKQSSLTRLTRQDLWELLSNPQNWILTFYSGLAFSPVAVFGGLWGNPFLQEAHHLSHTSSATLISFVFIGLAIGGPMLGLWSDKIGRRRVVMFAGTFLSFISLLSVIYIMSLPLYLMVISLFLFGFGTGAFMLGFAIGKEINKIALAATVIALINTGDAIFGAVSEPLVGKLLDMGWGGKIIKGAHYFSIHDYHTAFLLLIFYLIIALILIKFIRESKKSFKS